MITEITVIIFLKSLSEFSLAKIFGVISPNTSIKNVITPVTSAAAIPAELLGRSCSASKVASDEDSMFHNIVHDKYSRKNRIRVLYEIPNRLAEPLFFVIHEIT